MRRFYYILISLIIFPVLAAAQPKVKTWLSEDTVRFAQPVVLNIQVTVPKGAPVKFPKVTRKEITKDLAIAGSEIDTTENDGQQTLTLKVTLIPLDDTIFGIPHILFMAANEMTASDSLTLVVLPIEKDSAKLAQIDTSQVIDIFDVTQPLGAPVTLKELWLRFRYYLLGLLALLLLAALVYWLYKKYKQRKALKQIPPERQLPPHELALQRLNALKEKKLYQQGKFKEFYSELSEILRQYLELNFHISALELTTSELEALLQNANLFDNQLYSGLMTVLKNADLVKFAKYQPLPTICETDLQFAFDFVEQTKPQPEPEEQDGENPEDNGQQTENQKQ